MREAQTGPGKSQKPTVGAGSSDNKFIGVYEPRFECVVCEGDADGTRQDVETS